MWKAAAGQQLKIEDQNTEDDDWETDADFENNVSEQEQRWGSTTIQGSGRTVGAINMKQLREETQEAIAMKKKKEFMEDPHNASRGYGGKFGVEKDRMDQSAVGHEYVAKVEKHASQKDYSTGFGGKFGIQTDRIDKSAVNWDHKEKIEKHASQKDYVTGFGGKFGVQTDRQDKSAVGWDHVEKIEKHESQKDYAKGFGGKFGVQSDRQDKSAVGWDHHEAPQKHESQTDHKIGFGGKFGLQTDRVDKSAASFNDEPTKVGTNYTKVKPDIGGAKPSDLRAKFETMSIQQDSNVEKASVITPKKTVHSKASMFVNKQVENVTVTTSDRQSPKVLDQSKIAFLTQDNIETQTEKIAPGQLDRSKIAQFTNNNNNAQENNKTNINMPKTIDHSKTAFLTQTDIPVNEQTLPGQLDQAKINQFNQENNNSTTNNSQSTMIKNEIEQLIQQKQESHVNQEEQIYENFQHSITEESKQPTLPNPTPTVEEQKSPEPAEYYTQDEIVDTGISAIALFDYEAAADDEISFDPEDIITHIEKIDEGWWRGLCKEKYGLFPANYVQVQENL